MEQPRFISIDFNYSGQKRASHCQDETLHSFNFHAVLILYVDTWWANWPPVQWPLGVSYWMSLTGSGLNVLTKMHYSFHANKYMSKCPCLRRHNIETIYSLVIAIQQMPLFVVSLCHKSSMVICLTNDAYNLFQWTQIVLHIDKNNELKETKDVPCHSSMIIWQKFTQ